MGSNQSSLSNNTINAIQSNGHPPNFFHPGITNMQRVTALPASWVQRPKRAKRTRKMKRQAFQRQGVFRFMDLPPELRELIYEELFIRRIIRILRKQMAVGIEKGASGGWITRFEKRAYAFVPSEVAGRGSRKQGQALLGEDGAAILLVSREIYKEAVAVLYSNNVFEFVSTVPVRTFIDSLGRKDGRALIRTVEVLVTARGPYQKKDMLVSLSKLTGIRSLVLRCRDVHRPESFKRYMHAIAMVVEQKGSSEERRALLGRIDLINVLSGCAHEWPNIADAPQRLRSAVEKKLGLA